MFPLEAKTNLNINDLNGFLDQTTWKESIELVWTISVQARVSTFFTTLKWQQRENQEGKQELLQ